MRTPISVGQALLILIDKYKNDEPKKAALTSLYFMGIRNEEDKQLLSNILQDEALDTFIISTEPSVIDNDPTKRYFETHFAFNTLQAGLDKLDINKLREFYQSVSSLAVTTTINKVNTILDGTLNTDPEYLEYGHAIKVITSDPVFSIFSNVEKEKLKLLISIAAMGTEIAKFYYQYKAIKRLKELPIDIYGVGIFDEENRGRTEKPDQRTVFSQYFGIFKSQMPIPADDVAMQESSQTFFRGPDRSHYEATATWPKQSIVTLTNPLVNTLSGTTLIQLRLMRGLQDIDALPFNDIVDFIIYQRNLISILMFTTGGHTFYEYAAPIFLDICKSNFKFMKGYDQLTQQEIFLIENEEAFQKAITSAIQYNKEILKKILLNESIKTDHFWRMIENDQSSANDVILAASQIFPLGPITSHQEEALTKKLMSILSSANKFVEKEANMLLKDFQLFEGERNLLLIYGKLIELAFKKSNWLAIQQPFLSYQQIIYKAFRQLDVIKLTEVYFKEPPSVTSNILINIGEILKVFRLEDSYKEFQSNVIITFLDNILITKAGKGDWKKFQQVIEKIKDAHLLSDGILRNYLFNFSLNADNVMTWIELSTHYFDKDLEFKTELIKYIENSKKFFTPEEIKTIILSFKDVNEEFVNLLFNKMGCLASELERNSAYNFPLSEFLQTLDQIKWILPDQKYTATQLDILQRKFSRGNADLTGIPLKLSLHHCIELADLYIKYDFFRPIPKEILPTLLHAHEQYLALKVSEKKISINDVNDEIITLTDKNINQEKLDTEETKSEHSKSDSSYCSDSNREKDVETASTASTAPPETEYFQDKNDNAPNPPERTSYQDIPEEIKDIYIKLKTMIDEQNSLEPSNTFKPYT